MRLINADALESTIQEQTGKCMIKIFDPSVNLILQDIRNAPSVDAEPVKHAYWEEKQDMNGDTYYHCTNCKEDFVFVEGTPKDNLYYYCPNCGYKMEGESE